MSWFCKSIKTFSHSCKVHWQARDLRDRFNCSAAVSLVPVWQTAQLTGVFVLGRRCCRPGERRCPSCLLGSGPGHPVLPRLPARLHRQAVQAPLPCLRPGRVRRLLAGAPPRPVAGLGPPRARLQDLRPETWGTLTAGNRLPSTVCRRRCSGFTSCHATASVEKEVLGQI